MRLFDITLPLQEGLAHWPGDTAYRYHWNLQMQTGANINLGNIALSVHAGTHADAPFHFVAEGKAIDACDLSRYIGPARVIDLSHATAIRIADVTPFDLTATPRVLFKTLAWSDPTRFPETVPTMEEGLPAYLGSQGVTLVGVDVPSVDAIESKDLPIHHALQATDIWILESLYLAQVPAGIYELVALPLKLVGGEAAPVRALLRDLPR